MFVCRPPSRALQVLWPGLLGNGGPSCADAGHAGVFTSADPSPPASDRSRLCNDDTNSDGDGEFGRIGATAVTVQDVVRRMNSMDWTSGIRLFQVRVAPRTAAECRTFAIGDECLPEARPGGTIYSDAPYGRNWTAPTKPLSLAFRFHTAAELGSDPRGETTASPASFRTYPPDGFAAFVIPFFSTTYLPEERGPGASITDFQLTRATRQNGRTPRFLCVRLSWEGTHVHQLCDPNDPTTGATTGLVRAAIVEFWNDLKRARYLDDATRMFGITIPMASNNVGSQARVRIFFELTSSGALLPSYDSQTRILSVSSLDELELFLWIGLGFCAYFCMIEVVEILGLEDGTFDLDDVLTCASRCCCCCVCCVCSASAAAAAAAAASAASASASASASAAAAAAAAAAPSLPPRRAALRHSLTVPLLCPPRVRWCLFPAGALCAQTFRTFGISPTGSATQSTS